MPDPTRVSLEQRLVADEARLARDEARLEEEEAQVRESRIVAWLGVGLAIVTALLARETTKEEINEAFKAQADSGGFEGILRYSEDPIVSSDIVKSPFSSIYDADLTSVMEGTLVKVVAWYDNEWGYSNRCVELAQKVLVRAHA